jgi:D-lactate dehydrogenase (cytochrome)
MEINLQPDQIQRYLEDSSNLKGGFAEGVVFPKNADEISEFLKEANQKKIPATVSGGGTGVTGGRIPFGGMVLSLEKLNRILKIEKNKGGGGEAAAEAGVLLSDFQRCVAEKGLLYPPDPTETTAFLGGTVAVNASGARTLKYGPTRDYVNSLKVVLPGGDRLQLERGQFLADEKNNLNLITAGGRRLTVPLPTYKMPAIKHQAGFFYEPGMDAIDLFIGSEGTLGVIYEIGLKLISKLKGLVSLLVFFDSENKALEFVAATRNYSKNFDFLAPIALEYLDKESLEILRQKYSEIPKNTYAILYEQEIAPEETENFLEKFLGYLEQQKALADKTWTFSSEKEFEFLKEFRHSLPELVNEKIKRLGILKIGTDLAVPDEKIFEMMAFYRQAIADLAVEAVIFGHIGNNHFHVNFFPKNEAEVKKVKNAYLVFVRKAVALGGTVSAEHGIGKTKHEYLKELYSEKGLQEMAAIKKIFDPNWILNRDDVIPPA